MRPEEIFPGVFKTNNKLYTKNLVKGKRVYGEQLIKINGNEYREWVPQRSKLAAAILNGMKENPINKKSIILYLGAASGTTVSHISDIVINGFIYAVEFSERAIRKLLKICESRKNIMPILADARKPEEFYFVESVDVIYCDIAQPDETEIVIRNANEFLKNNGYVMIAVKSQSIDVTKKPQKVYEEEKTKLEKANFSVIELIDLEPFEKDHCMLLAKKQ